MDRETTAEAGSRMRARELLQDRLGVLRTGQHNSITDVKGVLVGHCTLYEADDIRTGVTAIRPHAGNLYKDRVPAGLSVANGFGKLIGATQVAELGELETPILLTNTLAAPRMADALIRWTLEQPGNGAVTTVNPFVGETNDSKLNNIRLDSLQAEHARQALEGASPEEPAEGVVGAGTGTVAFGFKGGIGTSSRVLTESDGGYTVGALVQSNYGGVLSVAGVPLGQMLTGNPGSDGRMDSADADGSIMIVIATDAPLADRNLRRLAARGHAGLARTGSGFSNGSGDYSIAFSVAGSVIRRRDAGAEAGGLANDRMSPLFLAAVEAVEEAILNSLFMAVDVTGYMDRLIPALPLDLVRQALQRS